MSDYVSQIERNGQAPYLGCAEREVNCDDAAKLPRDVRAADIWKGCKNLDQLANCRELVEVKAELHVDVIDQLKLLPNLRRVQFRLPRSDHVAKLAPLSQVETLVLCCNKHQTTLNFIKGMNSLKNLCVSEAMGVSRITAIGSYPELRELYIDGTISARSTIETLAPISRLKELRYLSFLTRLPKEKRTLKPLLKLRKLEYLYLSDDYSNEEYLLLLRRLPSLTTICFNGGKRVTLPQGAG